MRNLHKYIKENHGREAIGELQQWEKRNFDSATTVIIEFLL